MYLHTPILRALSLGRFRTHCLRRGWLAVGIVSALGTISVAQAATDCNAVTEISKIECESLLQLYHSTDGANWKYNKGWNVTHTPCSWRGVTCGNNGVTKIELADNKLKGTIPNFSGLPKLTRLSLFLNNQLTGAVPDFSGLPNLTVLSLFGNQLTGAVPDFSGLPNLKSLYLDSNQLTGAVPDFSGLPNLERLNLYENQLTGAVPDFSGLPNLTDLALYENQLTGAVPDFSGLPNLVYLSLFLNQLTGAVPDFSGMPNLVYIGLSSNQLTGAVPDFSGLPKLTYLELSENQLTGAVPDFSGLPNLTELELSENQLTGAVPDFSGLPNLTKLALSNNQLTGAIPDLSPLTNLTSLALQDNKLCKESHINYAAWALESAFYSKNDDYGWWEWKSSPTTWQEVLNGFPNCPVNQPPTADFTVKPQTGESPLTVNLDGSLSDDPDGNIVEYKWITSDGQQIFGRNKQITFNHSGSYTITLTVTDNDGLTATKAKTVTVTEKQNQAPTAHFTVSPQQGEAPLTIHLDASGSKDDDGTIVNYEWTVNGQVLFGTKAATTLTAAGDYQIVFTVTDNQGATDTHRQTITVEEETPLSGADQAIIIAAGNATQNPLWRYTNDFTQRMYRLLKSRQLTDEDIHYLSPHAPDIEPWDGYLETERQDFDLFDPAQELPQAFDNAANRLQAGQQLVVYLHGHARPNYIKIKWDYELSASVLRDLLARIPAGVEQVIILDTCFAGSFLDELQGVANRIVVTSSDDNSYGWDTQYKSFSDQLIRELRRDNNLKDAFLRARDTIIVGPEAFHEQDPWLDDDGDGQYTSFDGRRAASVYLGREGVHKADIPEIVQVHPRLTLTGDTATATLWVTVLSTPEAIKQVRAVLIRPDLPANGYQGESTDFGRTELALRYNAAKPRYEIDYDHFCTSGTWRIAYQVQDTQGIWSDIKTGILEQAPTIQAPICQVPTTIQMDLNNFRYTADDTFRLDMTVAGEGLADTYVAIVFPDNNFVTLSYPDKFSFLNTAQPYRQGLTISGQRVYSSVLALVLPPGLPVGSYSACGVLVQPNAADVLDSRYWIHLDCAPFEVY